MYRESQSVGFVAAGGGRGRSCARTNAVQQVERASGEGGGVELWVGGCGVREVIELDGERIPQELGEVGGETVSGSSGKRYIPTWRRSRGGWRGR